MKNIFKFFAFFALLFSAFSAFSTQARAQGKNEILIVADQKASCRGIVAQDCLQVKRLNEERFNPLRQNIVGFNYQTGFYYVLEVRAGNSGREMRNEIGEERAREEVEEIGEHHVQFRPHWFAQA